MITHSESETKPIDELESIPDTDLETAVNDQSKEINGDRSDPEPEERGRGEGDAKEKATATPEGTADNRVTQSESVVSLKSVSKHYGSDENLIRALDNVDLKIRTGAVVSIMGPSGSGKSTLINMIGSLDVPTHGEVIIDGTNLENMSHKELTKYRSEKVGFIFQTFNLLPNLTALENVELPMEFNEKYRDERRTRAENLLKSIGMTKRADHFPASLSGGEKQRVAIARALANNPSIILADEPTGNLDSKTGKQIIDLLKKLAKNRSKTLIIVTHDHSVAQMTDEIINITDGKITRIRDVSGEQAVHAIVTTLDIKHSFVNLLFEAGYETVEGILDLTDAELAKVKGLKTKDRSHIINRINKSKKKVKMTGKFPTLEKSPVHEKATCPHCGKEIFQEGAKFCPFCAGKMDA